MRRVADALAYAHARGVVHCDIKPANIFLGKRDRPKVLDFGIARVAHRSTRQATQGDAGQTSAALLDGMVAGSPHYLAPEQLQGGDVDARTDIHALGVVFYELLTLRKAFDGDSVEQITTAVLSNHPAPAHELRPGVPRTLSAIATKAMAREPAERYANAGEMAAELRRWVDRHPARATTASDRDGATTDRPAVRNPARRRLAMAAAGLAAVALLALALRARAPRPPAVAVADKPAVRADKGAAKPAAAGTAVAAPAGETAARGCLRDTVRASVASRTGAPDPTGRPRARAASQRPRRRRAGAAAASTQRRRRGGARGAGHRCRASGRQSLGRGRDRRRTAGTTPPLTSLTLPAGVHQITVRNADFTPFNATVQVSADRPVTVRHRFGS